MRVATQFFFGHTFLEMWPRLRSSEHQHFAFPKVIQQIGTNEPITNLCFKLLTINTAQKLNDKKHLLLTIQIDEFAQADPQQLTEIL